MTQATQALVAHANNLAPQTMAFLDGVTSMLNQNLIGNMNIAGLDGIKTNGISNPQMADGGTKLADQIGGMRADNGIQLS